MEMSSSSLEYQTCHVQDKRRRQICSTFTIVPKHPTECSNFGSETEGGLDTNPYASNESPAPSAPSLPLGGIQPSERPYYPGPGSVLPSGVPGSGYPQQMAQPNPNSRRVPIGNNWDMMRTADNRVCPSSCRLKSQRSLPSGVFHQPQHKDNHMG